MTQPRGRPPWWPADEPWPPRGRPSGVPAFFRRVLLLVFAFFLIGTVLSVVTGVLFADRHGPPPLWGLLWLTVIGTVLFVGTRVTRRFGMPIGDVLTALDRLAAGDYGVRVQPQGPPPIRAIGQSLNTAAARLAAAEEQRRNLMADIAHEVRNPLSVIRGNVEGVADGLYEPTTERMQTILDEVEVIARLIDDLSLLSAADAGVLQLHRAPVDLGALLSEVASAFEARAQGAGVAISVEAASEQVVDIDEHRIRQVLENLLSNALRHTPSGGAVHLGLRRADDGVEVEVRDTGAGIAPEDLPHIFERYRKAPDSEGSGLGLAIAQRLVAAHGGSIHAESAPGQGTTIAFVLPNLRS